MASVCLFCKIAAGEIPAKLVHQDEQMVAFRDINPVAPTHILLIPRRHIASLDAVHNGDEDQALLGALLMTAAQLAREEGLADDGYRVVTNIGPQAGQSVPHLHFHLIGGRAMSWPPG
jgi:histidine triad (HIT) family protein